ncbi:Proofreading thioesterase EntH [Corynebacterium kalinowskii]|uniref:Proofreading thioesterase EntH n=1 Tax=Corynebacterium kalinowskii TaxID=2675216 RepID=A0A6B8VP84_9CORY|nr:PaaI family thioesterase [Corynebacterium kalinowskii]QGU03224.1 Proofreading thioesterase EntH [Corynebacterium kalinowskii]
MEPISISLGELDIRMGVEVVSESVERVEVRMPVERNRQSLGALHGGAMACLGEMAGSWAALKYASTLGKACVGVDINATHHRGARSGFVRAVATPIKLGRTLTSHEVVISAEESGERLCTVRITNAIVEPLGDLSAALEAAREAAIVDRV